MSRLLLGGLGVAIAAYGAWLLLSRQGLDGIVSAGLWLGVGVVAHDFVLVPLVLLAFAVGSRWVPRRWQAPVAAGLIVLGSVTLLAIPVLGRFGARTDNTTLLDRPYWLGWLGFAAVVAAVVVLSGLRRSREKA